MTHFQELRFGAAKLLPAQVSKGRPTQSESLAVACALHTDAPLAASGPLPGLISQSGNHRPALAAMHPLSTQRLDGHTALPEALLLTRLRWPSNIQPLPTSPVAAR